MNHKFQNLLLDIQQSAKSVQVLPSDSAVKEETFAAIALRPESLLEAILSNTGGIVIDNWLRLYGCGELIFLQRNRLCPIREIVVGEDILGGLFLCLEGGSMGYFAPDTLEVEDMDIGLGQFVHWCLHGVLPLSLD